MSLCLLLSSLFALVKPEPIVVNTSYGSIRGKYSHDKNVREFLSIPYAAPPLDDLRFAATQRHSKWNGTYNATIEPWGCPQTCSENKQGGAKGVCPSITKEDCLILNIYAPNNKQNESHSLYPVLIYLHGGGFYYGFGGGTRLNASRVVNFTQSVIIVLINYRLGALGAIYDESMGLYGNQFYYDQLMAAQWIYDEIINFGGDRNNIIIYGQSAGAISVGLHLMNMTNTIIHGGIMESNVIGFIAQTPKTWGNFGQELANAVGCNVTNNPNLQLQCLRSYNITANDILQQESNAWKMSNATLDNYAPTVETDLFVSQPIFAIQNGYFNPNFSLIIGSVANEYNLYYGDDETQTPSQFTTMWNNRIGKNITQNVINYYNVPMYPDDINVVEYSQRVNTDAYIRCPSRNMSAEVSIQGNKKPYFYHLNYASPNVNSHDTFPDHTLCWNYACHTSDLWYVFDPDLSLLGNATYNWSEIILLKQMQSYWTNFAFGENDNNPNIGPNTKYLTINWTQYDVKNRNGLIFDIGDNLRLLSNIDDDPCNFWDTQNYAWLNITHSKGFNKKFNFLRFR